MSLSTLRGVAIWRAMVLLVRAAVSVRGETAVEFGVGCAWGESGMVQRRGMGSLLPCGMVFSLRNTAMSCLVKRATQSWTQSAPMDTGGCLNLWNWWA